ncbi:MAG: DUF4349 domain-containing protein [Erythrobacter sp.]|nr:DUF4349 domain-containing protein [Erythrobacter sp.]
MRKSVLFPLFAATSLLALAGCSQADDSAWSSSESVAYEEGVAADMVAPDAEAAAATAADTSGELAGAAAPIPVTMPQLAYQYGFSFSLPGEDMRRLQRQHATLCEQQGPTSCIISGMTMRGEIDGPMTGELEMMVATNHARAFGALLEEEAEDMGAEQLSADVATEEVSRALVDTEARLASRIELRDRLREVLRTRRGTVEELIQAERGVAAVNEEIDQARAWLNETRGRVAMSRMTVHYESATPVGSDFLGPVAGALGSVSGILGMVLAALILVVAIAGPIAGVALAIRWFARRTPKQAMAE